MALYQKYKYYLCGKFHNCFTKCTKCPIFALSRCTKTEKSCLTSHVLLNMNTTDTLSAFWDQLRHVFSQCERHYATDDILLAEQLLIRVEECESVLRVLLGRAYETVPLNQSIIEDVEYLLQNLRRFAVHLTDWNLRSDVERPRLPSFQTCPVYRNDGGGRPAYLILQEELEALIELGFNFHQIASMLGVSERTIRRRREVFGLPIGADCYTQISDKELDTVLAYIMHVISLHQCAGADPERGLNMAVCLRLVLHDQTAVFY